MPINLSETLVVGISATALFDLAEADRTFNEQRLENPDRAIETYRAYMLQRENVPLEGGTGLPLVRALLGLNRYQKKDDPNALVEVVVMSRNSPETGVRVLNTIRSLKLGITRSAFTGGDSVVAYLPAYDVDLFLSTSKEDAQAVADARSCAVAILGARPQTTTPEKDEEQVRIAFDGDAVLFEETSELVFKTKGLTEFHATEDRDQDTPLAEGPYAVLLKKLAKLQERLPVRVEYSPVRIAIVTARNSPAEMRVIKTLRHWNVYVDCAFFLGGLEKTAVLQAFRAHIFFDDQEIHLEKAARVVPAGHVPYPADSALARLAAVGTKVIEAPQTVTLLEPPPNKEDIP